MDSSMWQTIGTVNFTHSLHKWLPSILSFGQCGSTLSTTVISRFRFYRGSRRLKINMRRSFVHFRKSHVCTDQLDVQEANFSFMQLYWTRDNIVWCWFAFGWFTCTRLVGFGHWSTWNDSEIAKTQPKRACGKPMKNLKHTQGSECGSIKCISSSFECTSLWERITVVHFRRQRSCEKDDHQWQKPDDETRIPYSPSCSWLVVRSELIWTPKIQIKTSRPKTNSQTS